MNYFYLGNDISPDTTKAFLEKLESSEKLTVYISSSGGECYASEAIMDAMNNNKEKIEVVACGNLSSNAFWLFFNFKGKRDILSHATGMFHYCGSNKRIMENGRMEYADDRLTLKEDKKRAVLTRKWCVDLGFTKSEMRKMESGEYLFFGNDRLKELLNA